MSAQESSAALRAPAALAPGTRSAVRALAWPAVAVLAFAALVAITWGTWGDIGHDTGYDLLAADRLAHGHLPYADFPYIYGPLGVAVLGGAFALFGSSLGTAIAVGLVLAAAATALTYALAREVTGRPGAAVAAALAASAALGTGNIGLVLPHAESAAVAVVVSLAALLAGARYARSGDRRQLVLSAAAVGALALTRPEFLAAAGLAFAAWLGVRIVAAADAARRRAVADAALFAAIAFAVPALVYGAILTQVGGSELLHENLFPSDQLAAGGSAVLHASAPLTAGSFAELVAHAGLYAAGIVALIVAAVAIRRGGRSARIALAVCGLAVAGFMAALQLRPEAVRSHLDLAYAWIPLGAASCFIALAWGSRAPGRPLSARRQAALLCSGFLAVLAGKTYAAFAPQPNPDFAQYATYALPFAAVGLVWLHAELLPRGDRTLRAVGLAWVAALGLAGWVLVARDARDETFTVKGPGGSLAAPSDQGPAYQAALDRIVANTAPGDPVLLAPQLSALYTLSERSNPLPELSLLPGSPRAGAGERRAIARLRDVNFAVTDRRRLTEYGQGAFGVTFHRRLGAWLQGEFRHVATVRGASSGGAALDFWQRSTR